MIGPGGRTPRPAARGRRLVAVLAIAAVVVAVDQVTKSLAVEHLSAGPVHVVGPISLALAYNSGIAFSIGSGLTLPIVIAVAALVGVVAWAARGASSAGATAAFGLVLGGALGNLSDRLLRGHRGAVVDFVHVGFWPTFNVADACIVCGCAALAWRMWRHGTRDHSEVASGAPAAGGSPATGGDPSAAGALAERAGEESARR
ncbi:MAG TPA: signal peptidase II [Acidimicrobiales bacterium]|nr:signal peptidase II [Acidimicrobiales bacterium]